MLVRDSQYFAIRGLQRKPAILRPFIRPRVVLSQRIIYIQLHYPLKVFYPQVRVDFTGVVTRLALLDSRSLFGF